MVLSAQGPKAMALTVAIADGWVSLNNTASEEPGSTYRAVASQVRGFDEVLASSGRDATTLHRVLLDFEGDERPLASYDAFIDWAGRYGELGFDELVVHWPTPDSQFACDPDVFERIATEGRSAIG